MGLPVEIDPGELVQARLSLTPQRRVFVQQLEELRAVVVLFKIRARAECLGAPRADVIGTSAVHLAALFTEHGLKTPFDL